ncbi:MAG: FAD-dependent oxidoreductase [Phototrophicaceae bacterium]
MTKVAVIGAGIIGLTSAIRLQDAGYDVSIFTKELTENTTSTAAGAVWWGYGEGKVQEWARRSLKVFQQDIANNLGSVTLLRLHDVYHHQAGVPWFHDDIPYCQPIPKSELKSPYVSGFIIDIPLITPTLYLEYLLERYQAKGGDIFQKDMSSLSELSDDYSLIINCTGLGAREIADDEHVHPIRGQTVLVDAPTVETGFMDDEHFTYIFPRADGVVLGGILQANEDNLAVDMTIRQDILMRCIQVDERLKNSAIIKETVGLRPGRYEVRLEAETLSDSCTVIHNYGHAGLGFTLSWGCAEDVLGLAQGVLGK